MCELEQKFSFLSGNTELLREFEATERKYSAPKEVVDLPRETTRKITLVECAHCHQAVDASKAKCTMVRNSMIERKIKIWNPDYKSPTKCLIYKEDEGGMVLYEHDENEQPVSKWLYHTVETRKVEYTCMGCVNNPVFMSIIDTPVTPEAVLNLADEIRALREEHGAKLTILTHGRKIDTAVEMICQKLHINYQEVNQ